MGIDQKIRALKPEFAGDREFLKRFEVEAQAAASLSHPNIVSVYDVGFDAGRHYIVMELGEGITLKAYIAKKGALPISSRITLLSRPRVWRR